MTQDFIYTIFRYAKDDEKSNKFQTIYSNEIYAEENVSYYADDVLNRISNLEDFNINGEVSIDNDFAFAYCENLKTGEITKSTIYEFEDSIKNITDELT